MIRRTAIRILELLPRRIEVELMHYYYTLAAARGRFRSPEPEFARLSEWIEPGSFVIDVGANIGHYTRRMAELAGPTGAVLALEPVPRTFALLAASADGWRWPNVILLNAAASSECTFVEMNVPREDGRPNYYQSTISPGAAQRVLAVRLDDVVPTQRVALIKVDAEGHELHVLEGLRRTIARDRPQLIVEGDNPLVRKFLEPFGYVVEHEDESPNVTARAAASTQRM